MPYFQENQAFQALTDFQVQLVSKGMCDLSEKRLVQLCCFTVNEENQVLADKKVIKVMKI